MTEIQKLKKELDELNDKRKAVIEENSVKCGGPKLNRNFTYRKNTIINAGDVCNL